MRQFQLFSLAAVIACASGGSSSGGLPVQDRNVITNAELTSVNSSSLYDAIEKLRPHFLRSRGPSSLGAANGSDFASVFVDGRPYGDIGSLRSLIPAQLSEVRYYDAMSAQQKFGLTSGNGVIDVTVKRGSP